MKAVGIDAVELERIDQLLAQHEERFLARVYTAAERELAGSAGVRTAFFGGRFAAKEAVLKALGTGWSGGIRFTDVEILRDDAGAPYVRLHGLARARSEELGWTRVLVSITHTTRDAHAMAVAE